MQLAGLNTLDVHYRYDAADDHGKLQQAGRVQIFRLQRHVRGAEGYRLRLDLLDTAARPDGLVIEADTGELLVGLRPLGVDRVRKGGAGARDVRCGGDGGQT